MKLIDITGQRFSRLFVLRKSEASKNGGSLWVCLCDCGTEVTVNSSNIRNGSTRSCGCLAAEWAKQLGANKEFIATRANAVTKHGCKRRGNASAEYKTWLRIKSRCYRKSDKDYQNWGGRGIRVCDRWNSDFQAFLTDMGPRPSNDHSIDRIDSNGDYCPENCRWATSSQQGGENKRGLLQITVHGIDFKSISSACRHFGLKYSTVKERLRTGMDVTTAFTDKRPKSRRTKESYLRKDMRGES